MLGHFKKLFLVQESLKSGLVHSTIAQVLPDWIYPIAKDFMPSILICLRMLGHFKKLFLVQELLKLDLVHFAIARVLLDSVFQHLLQIFHGILFVVALNWRK
jgi:hypothetical protein